MRPFHHSNLWLGWHNRRDPNAPYPLHQVRQRNLPDQFSVSCDCYRPKQCVLLVVMINALAVVVWLFDASFFEFSSCHVVVHMSFLLILTVSSNKKVFSQTSLCRWTNEQSLCVSRSPESPLKALWFKAQCCTSSVFYKVSGYRVSDFTSTL